MDSLLFQLQQVLHIHTYPNSQSIGILCQQCGTNDPPFVLGFLKVGVREEEKHLAELKDKRTKSSETVKMFITWSYIGFQLWPNTCR